MITSAFISVTSSILFVIICTSRLISRETIDRLEVYAGLLEKWNSTINLVSKNTINQMWKRHFLDSAQLWTHIPSETKTLVDIGS
ncbi:class I SAM-dependent methyltransferase, partial [Amylibacter sp.]|nr:class I SAM-dependent methyltransferase [Amylibacter sp.]